jgi:major membrane immunogen (membrane-anchored lipoprotein)
MNCGFQIIKTALLALLLLLLLACGGADERRQRHLQKAKGLLENGHYSLALEE